MPKPSKRRMRKARQAREAEHALHAMVFRAFEEGESTRCEWCGGGPATVDAFEVCVVDLDVRLADGRVPPGSRFMSDRPGDAPRPGEPLYGLAMSPEGPRLVSALCAGCAERFGAGAGKVVYVSRADRRMRTSADDRRLEYVDETVIELAVEEGRKVMASTRFKFNRTTREVVDIAREEGWQVQVSDEGSQRLRVILYHPKGGRTREFTTPRRGDANNAMIKWLSRETKRVRAAEEQGREPAKPRVAAADPALAIASDEITYAPAPEPAAPEPSRSAAEAPPPDPARAAEEAIVVWLDDRHRAGADTFRRADINNKRREQLGLPSGEAGTRAIDAALASLVGRGLLERTTERAESGKTMRAYRIAVNGEGVLDAWSGPLVEGANVAANVAAKAKAKAKAKADKGPAPGPAAKPGPAADGAAEAFAAALARRVGDALMIAVDAMIRDERYEELVHVIVDSGDVARGAQVLRRVAEIARGKA